LLQVLRAGEGGERGGAEGRGPGVRTSCSADRRVSRGSWEESQARVARLGLVTSTGSTSASRASFRWRTRCFSDAFLAIKSVVIWDSVLAAGGTVSVSRAEPEVGCITWRG
jgi:hypothetical protein